MWQPSQISCKAELVKSQEGPPSSFYCGPLKEVEGVRLVPEQ